MVKYTYAAIYLLWFIKTFIKDEKASSILTDVGSFPTIIEKANLI